MCSDVNLSLVHLEGRVTANQHKVVLSHHLYPMMKHFVMGGLKREWQTKQVNGATRNV